MLVQSCMRSCSAATSARRFPYSVLCCSASLHGMFYATLHMIYRIVNSNDRAGICSSCFMAPLRVLKRISFQSQVTRSIWSHDCLLVPYNLLDFLCNM